MNNQNSKLQRSILRANIVAIIAVTITICQGIFFYVYTRKTSQERLQIDFQNTVDKIKARSIVVVDNDGNERIFLGTGKSEFSDDINTSIKLTSPGAKNPIILSTTDEKASVSVSKRAVLGATEEANRSYVGLYRDEYKKGDVPRLALLTDTKTDDSRFAITNGNEKSGFVSAATSGNFFSGVFDDTGKPRMLSGINSKGVVFDEMYNNDELVYAVQLKKDSAYANTFIKQDPSAQIWNGMSTFSTIKTFWDILFKK